MIRQILPFIFLLFAGFHVIGPSSHLFAGDTKPNILLLYIDDFGWRDTGFNGSKFYETPNMDRIANEGINFTNAYSNAPNCAPARACLMSGLYAPRHGIYTVGNSDRGKAKERRLIPIGNKTILPSQQTTLAESIRSGGYSTAFLGKWHLGDGEEGPLMQGFDKNFGGLQWGHPKTYFSPYKNPYLKDGPKGEYLTDRLTDEADRFIRDHLAAGTKDQPAKPFFVCLSHYAVHTPIQAKPEITERYQAKPVVDSQTNAKYAAMIDSVDQGIGKLMTTIKELGAEENTLIILYSDNGGLGKVTDNTPLRGSKGMVYEGGIRVPLSMRWPGVIPKGATCDTPVIGVDLFPTLSNLAGGKVKTGHPLDGKDIFPLMRQKGKLDRDAIFWHFPAYLQGTYRGAYNDDQFFRTRPAGAIRSGDWKLIEHFEDQSVELFNLRADLGEKNDLSKSNLKKRDELYGKLKRWQKETNAPIPTKLNPLYDPS